MKKLVALFLALAMVFCMAACAGDNTEKTPKFKAGFIFLHDENSTYDLNFLNAAKEACEACGVPYFAQVGGGGMDANIYNAQGMKTIGVATGYSGNHTTTEQLVLEDFYKSGELAEAMIYAYAKRCKAK
jgi:putative aminopeptidase FrvX